MKDHPLHRRLPELHTTDDVQRAVLRLDRHRPPGTRKLSNAPAPRLDAFASRLERIFLTSDAKKRARNIEALRPHIHTALVIKRHEVPEEYFELQKRVAREQGHGDITITPDMRTRMIGTLIEDQTKSLDIWLDYLTSDDAGYPAWFRFFAFHQITKLSQFDKERQAFKKRTETTTAPFPDIDREALAQVCDLYERAQGGHPLTDDERQINTRKFPAAYAHYIDANLRAHQERSESIKGEWRTFKKGNMQDARALHHSLQGKGTGWCTAGESTARTQVQSGDFYVFYSTDPAGNPTQPRLAIRMQGDDIAEVRGVLPSQNVEPVLQPVLDEQLATFGAKADRFMKRSDDMRRLTEIETAIVSGTFDKLPAETKQHHLRFLYELDHRIEGFGYQRDPRITQLRARRNTEQDLPLVFGCEPHQIAHTLKDIYAGTKAYIGPLEPGTFDKLPPTIEHVYTSFSDQPITFKHLTIGGKTAEQLRAGIVTTEAYGSPMQISSNADLILGQLSHKDIAPEGTETDLAILSVAQLGFPNGARTQEIHDRAHNLGLEVASWALGTQIAAELRREITDQPPGDWLMLGMEPLADRDGGLHVFSLDHFDDGLWLGDFNGHPDNHWHAGIRFVFGRRT